MSESGNGDRRSLPKLMSSGLSWISEKMQSAWNRDDVPETCPPAETQEPTTARRSASVERLMEDVVDGMRRYDLNCAKLKVDEYLYENHQRHARRKQRTLVVLDEFYGPLEQMEDYFINSHAQNSEEGLNAIRNLRNLGQDISILSQRLGSAQKATVLAPAMVDFFDSVDQILASHVSLTPREQNMSRGDIASRDRGTPRSDTTPQEQSMSRGEITPGGRSMSRGDGLAFDVRSIPRPAYPSHSVTSFAPNASASISRVLVNGGWEVSQSIVIAVCAVITSLCGFSAISAALDTDLAASPICQMLEIRHLAPPPI